MGCITSVGRVVLVIINMFFLLISLALVAAGVVLKFFPSKVMDAVMGAVSASLDQQTKEDFNIPDLEDISDLPFVGEIGIALISFGALLFFVSFMGCCGACCQWRPLLIVFVIVMSILVIIQAVVGGLFLAKNSVLHENIEETLGDKVKEDFDADGDDVFSFSINIMQYLLECCGIRDKNDFSDYRPPTCCKREIIDGDSNDPTIRSRQEGCTNEPPTAPETDYNQEGCYTLLQDKVLDNLTLAAIILSAILLLQVLEIVFACLIVIDVSVDNKVAPR